MNAPENEEIKLSIVIAAWNGVTPLRQCLASLEKQTDRIGSEVIVVSNFPVSADESSTEAKFLQLPATATVPELRSRGIELANGEVVALLEDHCVFDSNWCREIKKAHESTDAVIGGSVENASVRKALDWAVYFYDYGKYMLPNTAGAADSLSGINTSYKRTNLEEIAEVYRNGFFESEVNEELKKRGHQLVLVPSAIVYHNKSYEVKRAAEHSYHLARSYAAKRVSAVSISKRITFTVFSLILPVLLPLRIISTTVKKGRNISQMIRALPFIILLMFIWSYGEFCGYLLGEGKSAGEWR